jgi:hypothetical protein
MVGDIISKFPVGYIRFKKLGWVNPAGDARSGKSSWRISFREMRIEKYGL